MERQQYLPEDPGQLKLELSRADELIEELVDENEQLRFALVSNAR